MDQEFDAAYERLLSNGSVSAHHLDLWLPGSRGVVPWGVQRRWLREKAAPWWEALVARANRDGIVIHCFPGYPPDDTLYGIVAATASLLHPHTGMHFEFEPHGRERAIENWLQAGRRRWTVSPPSERDIEADYARLREHGSIRALAFAHNFDRTRWPKWRPVRTWERRQAKPWFAGIVRQARADRLPIVCYIDYTSDGSKTFCARAAVLDRRTGVELRSRLLSAPGLSR